MEDPDHCQSRASPTSTNETSTDEIMRKAHRSMICGWSDEWLPNFMASVSANSQCMRMCKYVASVLWGGNREFNGRRVRKYTNC